MFHYRSESTPRGRDPEKVRMLAAERGFRAERAARRNHWQLFRPDGTASIDPKTKSTAFSYADAIAFLTAPAEDERAGSADGTMRTAVRPAKRTRG